MKRLTGRKQSYLQLEIFSLVAKINTVRILMSITSNRGWPLQQFDVKNSFLNGDLEEEVYTELPLGTKSKSLIKAKKLGSVADFGQQETVSTTSWEIDLPITHKAFLKKNKNKTERVCGIPFSPLASDEIVLEECDMLKL
ncbi:Retrovirus-related Pol polyprotein from transposon TNT 1-94 [Abeliophyllum distichum]|uniref:Retrovirus-related Pol polyprotein from transposon TNT 1-94 n=1 Tax=Abeliophyllum distichum TaxID=126358 RepID=A0ABD1RYQ5_9LAMI